MRQRVLAIWFALVALALFVSAPALAADTHKGKVVEAGSGKLTMTDSKGEHQHTHEVSTDVTITCGGKKCGLEDLKAGRTVTVTMEKKGDTPVVTKIKTKGAAKKASS